MNAKIKCIDTSNVNKIGRIQIIAITTIILTVSTMPYLISNPELIPKYIIDVPKVSEYKYETDLGGIFPDGIIKRVKGVNQTSVATGCNKDEIMLSASGQCDGGSSHIEILDTTNDRGYFISCGAANFYSFKARYRLIHSEVSVLCQKIKPATTAQG